MFVLMTTTHMTHDGVAGSGRPGQAMAACCRCKHDGDRSMGKLAAGSGQKLLGVNVATVFTPTRQQICMMVTTLMFIYSVSPVRHVLRSSCTRHAMPCHVITANNETTDCFVCIGWSMQQRTDRTRPARPLIRSAASNSLARGRGRPASRTAPS